MNKLINLSKIALGIVALSLSTSLWAMNTWHPVSDTLQGTADVIDDFDTLGMRHAMSGPEYIVTDDVTGAMYEMDGIGCGHVTSSQGNMIMDENAFTGDRITDVRTNRSGVITGIRDQGTMDVTRANGKTVRYQYVTFKIKPEK